MSVLLHHYRWIIEQGARFVHQPPVATYSDCRTRWCNANLSGNLLACPCPLDSCALLLPYCTHTLSFCIIGAHLRSQIRYAETRTRPQVGDYGTLYIAERFHELNLESRPHAPRTRRLLVLFCQPRVDTARVVNCVESESSGTSASNVREASVAVAWLWLVSQVHAILCMSSRYIDCKR